ncbi:unnamed protein product [Symbiodinium pilosum]|uniref:Uncharacterized protein n=1 Tax=Symbiodinium pilosum TaxID=2952 RepID=A0A812W669_SYMPI|nr:unnamed protein product [Symbiodinium pilosum]
MAGKEGLVQQIKNMQRIDPTFKQTWWDFCESQLGGVRDPNRHDESVLGTFLEQYNSGAIAPSPFRAEEGWWGKGKGKGGGGGGGGYDMGWAMMMGGGLGDMIKQGQRASYHYRTAWTIYCALYGAGKNDPTKHDDKFIRGYLDYLGELATNGLSSIASSQGINLEEITANTTNKRPQVGGEAAPMKKFKSEPDEIKLPLAEKVKNMQRSNPAAKEAWWAYCDAQAGGLRDPMRHDTDSLQAFLTSQGAM